MSERVVIVGGGITGLVSAYIAARDGKQVVLIDAADKVGGLLNTFQIGGNELEFFYHHFFTHDAELTWLLKELEIDSEVVYKKTSMGVFRESKVFNFNSPLDLLKFKPISWIGKVRFVLSTLFLTKIAKWQNFEHVSAFQWFEKWAGKSATNALWGPMLKVKFGPFANKVPLTWMIGRLRQRMNSRKQGDERLGYLRGSLSVLCNALVDALHKKGVIIKTDEPVQEMLVENKRIKSIRTSKAIYEGDQFLFTLPTVHLKNINGLSAVLKEKLEAIEYFGVYCIVLSLKRSLSPIYWMNVADEGYSFGGIIEHTNLIDAHEYNGEHIVYLSRYFAQSEAIAAWDVEQVKRTMISDLKRVYNDLEDSDINDVRAFRSNTAAMVTDLNFSSKVPNSQTEFENLYLCNMAHIYPDERSVNNSIRIAAEASRVMGINSDYIPKNLSLSGKIGFLNK